ncbi:hypothetical protein HPB47_000754 [Ixodes persulcatus]|uniref:Uncharacterized protein n=1 Tax=Ixodes persulcatus TaxID=34615 RepID=A0AC60PRM6_IXOPE|nr:hypothetical protein HPB47_000754 [Ixodes persulcatus]
MLLEKECQDTLLFCYQSKFMRDIMAKYGGYVACMDATNKATGYALSLFLAVVKTPCGYVTVGVFIVQFETQTCISEARPVLRKWCPNFQPQYWMVDYSHAEINALHETFPESKRSPRLWDVAEQLDDYLQAQVPTPTSSVSCQS